MTVHVSAQAGGNEGLLPSSVKIGMPHLSLTGLSENWLLKECGHRHWFLLAEAAGEPFPNFRDAAGDQVYAVFRAVRVKDARLAAVQENEDLHFTSTLLRISRTQFESRHILTCRGGAIGEIEMISSFVKRQVANVNRSVARVTLEAFPFAGKVEPSAFIESAAGLWSDNWVEHFGFYRARSYDHRHLVIRPNPSLDFNGARFLYFSSFPALVDRTEWEVLDASPSLATVQREIFYYGNIEPGEKVVVQVNGVRHAESGLEHWCTLLRECDETRLADIFTRRLAVS
ncbi:MAG: hypothetical protein K2W78_01665 [Xanthobacteraceae bacterium]|nr:hypothetical protein [Xanthobacteraceae bacterium]